MIQIAADKLAALRAKAERTREQCQVAEAFNGAQTTIELLDAYAEALETITALRAMMPGEVVT